MKKNDLFLIIGVLALIIIAFVICIPKTTSNTAYVYYKGEIVLTINLEDDDQDFEIDEGIVVSLKDHMVGIISNTCKTHECIDMGFTNKKSKPIICAYNNIIISIGKAEFDLVI